MLMLIEIVKKEKTGQEEKFHLEKKQSYPFMQSEIEGELFSTEQKIYFNFNSAKEITTIFSMHLLFIHET